MSIDYIISPHDICDTCSGQSGPKFSLYYLRGVSSAHRTNIIPTVLDLQSLLDDVRDVQIDIDSLDTEIARLQQTLKVLEQRRADLHDFKYQELSLLAPIRRLPEDIIRKIFMTCQHVLEMKLGYIDYSNPNTFVRTVAQVSSYWRTTALSMPVLWSCVSFKKYRSNYKNMCISPGDFLEKCLLLSGSAPFSVEFADNGPSMYRCFSERSLRKLAKVADRWEHVTSPLEDNNCGIDLEHIMKYVPEGTEFSCLKTLGLLKSPGNSHTLPATPALTRLLIFRGNISLTSAPLLTNVYLSSYDDQKPQDILTGLSWSQITHYHSDNNFYADSLPIFLDSMPNLLSLRLNLYKTIELSTVMTLPVLEALTLEFHNSRSVRCAGPLNFFVTPKLKELNFIDESPKQFDMIFKNFLVRSQSNVENLSVSARTLFHEGWNIDLLQHLRHLDIQGAGYQGFEVMGLLTWKKKSRVLPRLQSITFDAPYWDSFYGEDTFPIGKLKGLVISRLPPQNATVHSNKLSYIKSVTLTFGSLMKTCAESIHKFRSWDIIRRANVDITVIIREH